MKRIIFLVLVSLTSCTKDEQLDCSLQTVCKSTVWSFGTCDDGKTFTDVRLNYAIKTMSVCDTTEYKRKMFEMWQRSTQDDDAIDIKFKETHPNSCGCNQ